MTRKECFAVLGLNEGADLDEIKRAYRKLAFSLHPDLNPDVPDAAKRFQRVNEAYVLLSKSEPSAKTGPFRKAARPTSAEATARAREEAKKAYSKARQGQEYSYSSSQQAQQPQEEGKEDVLRDILNDPFARRVFEDIYSHIREERKQSRQNAADRKNGDTAQSQNGNGSHPNSKPEFGVERGARTSLGPYAPEPGVVGKLKGWLRKQIDDEQVLRLPGESLIPGARVRLQIQHGLSNEPQVIELTLPPEFIPGKTMRLKGMGKRLGNWRGDLYVRIEPL